MTRATYIERILRQIYGGYVPADSDITEGMVNNILGDAIAFAAKQNYIDAIKLDGIGYVNNGFSTTFKNISVTQAENFLWKIELPHIPVGIGANEGVPDLRFKSSDGNVSLDCVPLTTNQQSFSGTMRKIPNKVLYYQQGKNLFAISTLLLNQYTASVTMVSGGDATDLDSELNVPSDYFPMMNDFILKQLSFEQSQTRDLQNNGNDPGNKQ